jgi:hypothetical protein
VHGVEVCVDQAGQVAAEPRSPAELHAVCHLVQRNPKPELVTVEAEALLDLGQVRPDEVQEPVVVRRKEHVVLPEHAPGHVAEQDADLDAERLATKLRAVPVGKQPNRDRFQEPLHAREVRGDPLAARHDPRPCAEPPGCDAGELGDEILGLGNDAREILPHARPIEGGDLGSRPAHGLANLRGHTPVHQPPGLGSHRPIDLGGRHRRPERG